MVSTVSKKILTAKAEKNYSWQAIADQLGMSPVWVTSACLGMNSMPRDKAKALCDFLELEDELVDALIACPRKTWDFAVPQDPLLYRLYEIVGVYGDTLKEIINEKFGDGIMSAIDFSMEVAKEENPQGDRVVITMNGKFLPYKSW